MKTIPGLLLLGWGATCLALSSPVHADGLSVSETRAGDSDGSRSAAPLALSLSLGAGQERSDPSRSLPTALGFGFTSAMLEVALGSADPERVDLDYAKATYFTPGWLQGSFDWFGARTEGGGLDFLPLNSRFLVSPGRGYFLVRPTVAIEHPLCALRLAPMAGRGYGQRAGNPDSLLSVSFAGFNAGVDGRISTEWLTGRQNLRLQAGASLDLYEDLTGHLGQVATSGVINNDTMTGLAFAELVVKAGTRDEWALGWKASYDRLTPYDPGARAAARNEDTAISLYFRWSSSPDVGSPLAGSTL